MVMVDPHFESEQRPMMGQTGANRSQLDKLLNAYGVKIQSEKVVLDALTGLEIRARNGGIERHFGFLGLGVEQLDRQDVITSGLELVNGASLGVIEPIEGATSLFAPIMQSSPNSDVIQADEYALIREPSALLNTYQSQNTSYVLASRVTGAANSAFATQPAENNGQEHKQSTEQLNLIVIADADLVADRFWVQQSNFFGQTVFSPFANNGDFIINALENLAGSNALISIRSRGTFSRPFTRVDELTLRAEERFREQEQLLEQQLTETERQLSQLQSQQTEGGALVLNSEQQAALERFMQQKIQIRKDLRDVRHQLDKDIESLGNRLKFINIALSPILLVLALFWLAKRMRLRSAREVDYAH
jgi:ABC-type uncharacterized transport system involved in gliding motility auxiliary subunit